MQVRTITLAKELCWNPHKFSEIKNTNVSGDPATSVCGAEDGKRSLLWNIGNVPNLPDYMASNP